MPVRLNNSTQPGSFFASPRRTMAGICLLLIVLVLAVFGQCRGFAFVNWDDGAFVYENKHVLGGLTWENARWAMTAGIGKDATDTDYWRPVSIMSHMLDVSLFGLNAGAHHMMSVALHALAAVLLFLVLRGMTGRMWSSAFVAAVFAMHPLRVESVAWVAERKDVLSGLFLMLALGAYLRHVRRSFRWGSYSLLLLMGALAMMSKAMLVTLPCVLLLLDHWPLGRTQSVAPGRLLVEKIPLFIMAFIVAGITLGGPGCANDKLWAALPWFYRVGNSVLSYGIYIKQTLWPTGLACFYTFPGRNLNVGHAVSALVVLTAITAVVWRMRRKGGAVVGWFWYLGMLVPVIGLFTQVGDQAHADRFTYLATIGLSLMVTWPAVEWAGEVRSRRVVLGSVAAAALVGWTITAHVQVSHWRDTLSLWHHAIECDPNDSVAHAHFGDALIEAGRIPEAISSYERALTLSPFHFRARMNLGIILLRVGKFEEAEGHLRRAAIDDPNTAETHGSLALILLRKNKLDEALIHLQKAADIRPDADNWYNLGNAQLQSGQFAKAIDSYLRVVASNSEHADAQYCLGMAYARLGKMDEAVSHYQSALVADPWHLPSINNLAWLLATSRQDSLRNGARAVELMQMALQLPGGSKVHLLHALAAAYAETGQFERAVEVATQVAAIAKREGNAAMLQAVLTERDAYLAGTPWRE
jgi:Flp pilus assembly protein TadD